MPRKTGSWRVKQGFERVPYINVNLPNDGGIVNNPYFVMLNPSLRTHVESVYRYHSKILFVEYDNGIKKERTNGRSYQNIY